MAEALAAETAVGPDLKARPVYAWPPLNEKQWGGLLDVLSRSSKSDAAVDLTHDTQVEGQSTIWIPESAITEEERGLSLFDWTEGIAAVLKRKQLRYGTRGGRLFVGFSEQLSEVEEQMCRDAGLVQREGKRSLAEAAVNVDGTQTLDYRAGLYKSDGLSRLRELVMSKVAPQLEGGVVLTNRSVLARGGLPFVVL